LFGLELTAVSLLHLASYQIECNIKKPPEINVLPSKSNITYDHSKTINDLNNYDIDTISPYGPGAETNVNGLMSGEISFEQKIQLATETYSQLGQGCLYINKIDISVNIDPTIYIAKEIKKGTCKYDSVMKHEKKHVKVDKIIVNRLVKRVGVTLYNDITLNGASFGPYRIEDFPKEQQKINERISKIVQEQVDIMNKERKTAQQTVDSLVEYERVDNECK
jgi:hypothetical protein